jgi:hypothetical protein
MLGAVGLGGALPMLTISLFGGVLADRMRKKSILIAGQFASAFVAQGIAVFHYLSSFNDPYGHIIKVIENLTANASQPIILYTGQTPSAHYNRTVFVFARFFQDVNGGTAASINNLCADSGLIHPGMKEHLSGLFHVRRDLPAGGMLPELFQFGGILQ